MAQTLLSFSIASTDERLTARSGEIIFGEYLKTISVDKLCDRYLPQPKSNRTQAQIAVMRKMIIVAHSLYKNDKKYVKPIKNTEVITMD